MCVEQDTSVVQLQQFEEVAGEAAPERLFRAQKLLVGNGRSKPGLAAGDPGDLVEALVELGHAKIAHSGLSRSGTTACLS